jgi:hypothetical protein
MDDNDRRTKTRFRIWRELRYKVLSKGNALQSGTGNTVDLSSGGVAFLTDQPLAAGMPVELSISWPALLDAVCPMRLSIVGRILRVDGRRAVCTVDRHEFRTQGMLGGSTLVANGVALERYRLGVRSGSSAASA